ncbi:putative B-box zinc finger protein [Blattamonas nauphoetae]|uniref:B-box zinc finger protein n=1 Tax=Blattamonas nauphoetae TaxID=2049346 RepID=A0ABQ9XT46_9EUKA|nr:putative B-box zinc finger protein [Blattamonas nauphoetae]
MITQPHAMEDFLTKKISVQRDSEDWSRMEYLLFLSLRTCSPVITNMWNVGSAHVSMQFAQRTETMLVLDSWVDTKTLDADNSLFEITRRGFNFDNGGRLFHTGTTKLNKKEHIRRKYEFLFCKVGVGRSMYYQATNPLEHLEDLPPLQPGFDSLFVVPPDSSVLSATTRTKKTTSDLTDDSKPFEQNYYISDPSQVQPLYIVQFEYNPADDEQGKIILCNHCEQNRATVYCAADDAYLCADCDEEIHRQNKLLYRHIRRPIEEHEQAYTPCPSHPRHKMEYFCPVCGIPVCVDCKMIGSHSSGEMALHRLVGLTDAYQSALNASSQLDTGLETKKAAVHDQLSTVDQKVKDVHANVEEVDAQMRKIIQEAYEKITQITEQKLRVLFSEEIELRRILGYMEWIDNFQQYLQDNLPPARFLGTWARHQAIRATLRSGGDIPHAAQSINDDLAVTGQIVVSPDIEANTISVAKSQLGISTNPLGSPSTHQSPLSLRLSPKRPSQPRSSLGITGDDDTSNQHSDDFSASSPLYSPSVGPMYQTMSTMPYGASPLRIQGVVDQGNGIQLGQSMNSVMNLEGMKNRTRDGQRRAYGGTFGTGLGMDDGLDSGGYTKVKSEEFWNRRLMESRKKRVKEEIVRGKLEERDRQRQLDESFRAQTAEREEKRAERIKKPPKQQPKKEEVDYDDESSSSLSEDPSLRRSHAPPVDDDVDEESTGGHPPSTLSPGPNNEDEGQYINQTGRVLDIKPETFTNPFQSSKKR